MRDIALTGTLEENIPWDDLRRIMLRAGLGLWRLSAGDDGSIVITVNDIFLKMLGLDKEGFPRSFDQYVSDMIHPDDAASVLRAMNIREPDPTFEIRHRLLDRRTGHWRWFNAHGEANRFDADGRPLSAFGCIIDIHEEIQAQEKLKESEAELTRRITERNLLLDDIQRQMELMMNVPGSRQDLIQKSLREEMNRLQADRSSGRGEAEGVFGRYMNLAFKFISNERVWYKAIIDSLPFPTSAFDLTRHWTYLNVPAAQAMGGRVPEFIGRHYRRGWKNFRDSDVVFQEGQAGKKNFIRHLLDSDRFFYCQSSILLDETGRAIGFIETMQDITDAHEADERMRVMLDAGPLACSFFDPDGELLDCNREAASLCGVATKQEYLRRFYELMPPVQPDGRESRTVMLEAIREAYDIGRSHMKFVLWDTEGREIPGDVQMHRVEWHDGYIVLGYCRDLRPLIAAQKELDRERDLLRDILDGCPVPFTITQDGLIKFATPSAERFFGLKTGDDVRELIVDRHDLADILSRLNDGQTVNWRPLRLTRADGGLSENLVNVYAADYEGRPSVMAWAVDVTELRENERELEIARDQAEASTRAKSDFLANISHEIRTPMNAVIGLTHLLSQTELTAQQRDYVTKSDSAAKSLLHLINDILDFSKIESGKFSVTAKEFYLSDVLSRAVDLVVGPAGAKGLEFMVSVDPDAPDGLVGDDQRLLQILGNLVGNAAKFTEKGEISLTVEVAALADDEAVLRFLVRDTGIGLDQEQIGRIFSAFDQADNSATRRYGGTGLGLAISKRLVEMMGGEIWCDSKPGRGSLFGFTVRFGRHDSRKRYIERRTDFNGLSVLAVDDNPTALLILKNYLGAMGFEVLTADSGRAAVDLAAKMSEDHKRLDLLVVDWKMPDLDGLRTAGLIREIAAAVHVPETVMATAYYGEEITARAKSAGIKAVLPKPLSPDSLYRVLGSVLREPGPKDAEKSAKTAETAELAARLAGSGILLVEDNEVNQLVARKILTKAGLKVTVAADGRQAVDAASAGNFDLVLMDIQMPVMDGLTATREIRKNPRLRDLPIVAMTAHALDQDREKSLAAGMNDHICKPLDVTELFRSLAKWIKIDGTDKL